MTTIRHSLSFRDEVAMTANCSVCAGKVKMVKVGRGYACVKGRREAQARYKAAHPDRAKADRNFKPSAHRLQNRKGGADTCAICGPVESIAQGWGFMCPTRAAELGWKNTQAAPQPKCPKCLSRHLDNMGACPVCDEPLPRYDQRPGNEWDYQDEFEDAGLFVREQLIDLPEFNESVVAGWRTLGFNDSGVRPEYAALYGGSR